MPRTVGPGTKSIAQAASITAGRLSSGLRVQPGFLIVGGQRCGTTSMYRTLAQHPLILKPVWHKGVHYFDLHYDRGLGWYRAHFPLRAGAGRIERALGTPRSPSSRVPTTCITRSLPAGSHATCRASS